MQPLLEALLDIFFPPKCAFCGAILPARHTGVCQRCQTELPYRRGGTGVLPTAAGPCAVAFYYEGAARKGVLSLKFEDKPNRAKVLGRILAENAIAHLDGPFDAVAYVPVSLPRNYSRGYDQAALLAQSAAACCGLPLLPALRKIRHNRRQSGLRDPAARAENVRGAYRVRHPGRVAGRRILLLDDVVTTGSTLAACRKALYEAGAASVSCAALAGGHPLSSCK